jgi:Endonuclease/Exonuclease/phosphatase family
VSSNRDIVIANFNIHAGIDGWGTEFDAVKACANLNADVLMIEEDWVGDDPCESIGATVARDGGYGIITVPLSQARRSLTPPGSSTLQRRWQPRRGPGFIRPLLLNGPPRSSRARATREELTMAVSSGSWAISLLSRLPILDSELIDLPVLRGDPARRKAIVATLDTGSGTPLRIIGVHLGHLVQGSPRQMGALRRHIATLTGPTLLVGDLNCWGPPLRISLHGMHDAVKGATWPSWRPHSRIDHILVSDRSLVTSSEVLPNAGSDHLPIRCSLRLP